MTRLEKLELAIRRQEAAKRPLHDQDARTLRNLADALNGVDNEWKELAAAIRAAIGEE